MDTRELTVCRRGERVQYAALPYRRRSGGLEVLLLTSRDTGRWVLPKGWPMKGKTPSAAARREAREEAGVVGRVGKRPIGMFHYPKGLPGGLVVVCEVFVFPLAVEKQLERWREQGQRSLRWFAPSEAAQLVQEPELADLLDAFGPSDILIGPRHRANRSDTPD
jgi:8-oxo-dGTP pyrophosphatase MutT (NUDIX family)